MELDEALDILVAHIRQEMRAIVTDHLATWTCDQMNDEFRETFDDVLAGFNLRFLRPAYEAKEGA